MGFSFFSDLISPTKYKVPEAPQLDINKELADNNAGNLASFQGAKDLASKYNEFQQNEVLKRLKESVPEFSDLQKQMASNLGAQLKGELTQSDLSAAQREGAAGALGLGIAGSGAGAAFSARNVGVKQFQLQQSAQQQAPAWLQTAAAITKAPTYDFSNVFMSPMQRAQLSWQNKTSAWNVQNMKNQMAAQPEPWMKALSGLGDSALTLGAGAAVMGGFGGMFGGGGGFGNSFMTGLGAGVGSEVSGNFMDQGPEKGFDYTPNTMAGSYYS